MDKSLKENKDRVVKTKAWFTSKTILLAAGLIFFNGLFLIVTYVRPSYESANATTPITPFSIGLLLILNIAFDAAIIWTRKTANSVIE